MTAYQAFLPTIVGIVFALPPANAQPLNSGSENQVLSSIGHLTSTTNYQLANVNYQVVSEKPHSSSPLTQLPVPGTPVPTPIPGENVAGGVRILAPQTGVISDRNTSLVIQYPVGTNIKVTVNGDPLDPKTPTQISRNAAQTLITQTWYGITLKEGENRIVVESENNQVAEVVLNVRSFAAKIEIRPQEAQIPADNRSTVTLVGRITDNAGNPINEDTVITLTASAGTFIEADEDEDEPGFQVIARKGQFVTKLQSNLQPQQVRIRAAAPVSRDRYVQIYNPFLEIDRSGNLVVPYQSPIPDPTLTIPYNYPASTTPFFTTPTEIEAYTQLEFVPNIRRSIATGVINLRIGERGTNFWGSLRDFLRPNEDGLSVDLTAQVFATGAVFGDWLFTGAYNSQRALNETCEGDNRLFGGIQFCEKLYPVYGDSSTIDYLTPSKDSVFVRLERPSRRRGAETDYIMWGDYNTREFARASQVFTATNRQLHGFKANYSFGNLQVTALYSPDVEGFQRDAIVPDGTSGYYFLSRRLVVPGSERIFIETQELNRPGTVVERKPLQRGPDYEIDYDRGTLLFRRPIFATDFDLFNTGTPGTGPLLVQQIVATYQFEGGEDTDALGTRLQYNFSTNFNNPSWAAISYWRENQGSRDYDLFGLDFLFPLGRRGRIVGEYARSNADTTFRGNLTGQAFRLEANGAITDRIGGRVYYRFVDEDFNNNATFSFAPGQTRYGASVTAQVTPTTLVEASYDREENFGLSSLVRTDFLDLFNPGFEARPGDRLDNSLTTIAAGVRQRIGFADVSVNYVRRERDDKIGNLDGNSNQIVSRLSVPLLRRSQQRTNVVTFRAQNELNLGDSDALYPNRTTLGLDWAVSPGVTVRLAHQFFDGGFFDNNSITSLDTIVERQLWKNTSVTSRYSIINSASGMTGQGALGVRSGILIAPGLRLNLGFERIQNDIFTRTGTGDRFPQPYAIGQSSYSLGISARNSFSVGLEYTDNPDFKASTRVEYRTGGSEKDHFLVTATGAGKVSRSLTALFRYEMGNFANQLIDDLDNSMNLRLGLAYRNPDDDRFNALLKYEFRQNTATTPLTIDFGVDNSGSAHVLSLEGIYAPTWRWEFFGKYALRTANFQYEDIESDTLTQIGQFRTTFRFAYRMDIAGEMRWIGQNNYAEWGWAAELGYYLTPDLRLGVGYSFGSVDDRDFSGFRSNGGPYFQITFKVNELFNGFGRQRPIPRPRPRDLPVATLPHLQPFTIAANPQQKRLPTTSTIQESTKKLALLSHLIYEINPQLIDLNFQHQTPTNQQPLVPKSPSDRQKNSSITPTNLTFANQPKLNLILTQQPHLPIITPVNSLAFHQRLTSAAPLIGTREWVVEKTPTQETQNTQESIISELRQKFLNIEFQVPNFSVK
ncbi:hypothetical protein ACE1B6_07715 [Aerosakkonemataceae cyanobacterium BLCC-F154]|uniref:TonB-dependent receptor n=1 Tax=Floridaenema fluviatile BLCC-F154 TaxID=3153640 RepID=A0ABV4Y8K6_9CYAN